MKEAPLVKKILAELRARGASGFWYKTHGGPYQQSGIPDILGCYNGLYIGFEVKAAGGRDATTLQQHTIDQITAAGGIALVIRSVEEAIAILDQVDEAIAGGSG